ncbi:hypothetical protein OD350_03680 [Clostridium beijerinckii]|uniref:hypothetical protein n=1 Tax=Clostridium beijerinckii TaxID=1520 RepID=UPI002226EE6F|nr:hypothetical protein [Clostridium beijerinckii]UYZ36783.1 hypothetical protein OD350_03680 [Clostridium beijerinckii]
MIEGTILGKIISLTGIDIEKEIATAVISKIFGNQNDTEQLVSRAVEEICSRITKTIDNAFMKEYIADTNTVAQLLVEYRLRHDDPNHQMDSEDAIRILEKISSDALETYNRLKRFDNMEGIFACLNIGSLRIICLKALSEYEESYGNILENYANYHGDWAKGAANKLVEITKGSVGYMGYFNFDPLSSSNPPSTGNGNAGYTVTYDNTSGAQLQFYNCFADLWAPTQREMRKIILSEKIKITNPMYYAKGPLGYYLDREGMKAYAKEYDKFVAKAESDRMHFLRDRLDHIEEMQKLINTSSESWMAVSV